MSSRRDETVEGAALSTTAPGRVLVIEDEEALRRVITRVLAAQGHSCTLAATVAEARGWLAGEPFDLVLSDVGLPDGSGLELAKEILAGHDGTAVVMQTAIDDPAVATLALEHGAYGFVIKPFTASELVIAVANALLRQRLERQAAERRERLELAVRERTAQLEDALAEMRRAADEVGRSRRETIARLARAIEVRDSETGGHIERMSRYALLVARSLGLDAERVELIELASPLHDVGKIAVPDTILMKPGALTPEERAVMERHAEMGYRILAGSDSPLLEMAAVIARTHHERFDGSGYPRGLFERAIPIAGRIAAVADVFDALTSDRVYRPAVPASEAVEMMREERGRHFDPQVLDAFLDVVPAVVETLGARCVSLDAAEPADGGHMTAARA